MPVAPNPLLQANALAKPSRGSVATADKPQSAGNQAGGWLRPGDGAAKGAMTRRPRPSRRTRATTPPAARSSRRKRNRLPKPAIPCQLPNRRKALAIAALLMPT